MYVKIVADYIKTGFNALTYRVFFTYGVFWRVRKLRPVTLSNSASPLAGSSQSSFAQFLENYKMRKVSFVSAYAYGSTS